MFRLLYESQGHINLVEDLVQRPLENNWYHERSLWNGFDRTAWTGLSGYLWRFETSQAKMHRYRKTIFWNMLLYSYYYPYYYINKCVFVCQAWGLKDIIFWDPLIKCDPLLKKVVYTHLGEVDNNGKVNIYIEIQTRNLLI